MRLLKRILLPGLVIAATSLNVAAQQADSTITAPENAVNRIRVSGTVKDAVTGKPLPGISISIPGYSAALTDDKGQFKVSVPNYNSVVNISGPGYSTKILALKGKNVLNASLFEENYTSLYDQAVFPSGKTAKRNLTGAVTTINTQGTWNNANETADSYLQGRVAGLTAQRRSGTPGIGADLLLQGYNSLYGTNQPLIVVDGMIYDVNTYGNSLVSGFRTNHFGNVELKDIDNITVVKDASSTYGTRGANGVIFITTGRAKDEATRLDFAAYGGFNSRATELPVLQADNYRVYLTDLLKTSNMTDDQIQQMAFVTPPTGQAAMYNQNTNWQDKVTRGGYSQNYYLKVTGGDNIATYALSMGYLNNDGLTNNTNLTRYQTRFNANLNLSQRLKGQANLAFTRGEQNLRDQGRAFDTNPLYLSLVKAPFLPSHELSDNGVESPNIAGVDGFNISNPYAAAEKIQAINRNYRFVGSVGFNYTISKAFGLQTVTGLTYDKVRENTFIPEAGIVSVPLNQALAYNRSAANVERLFSLYTDSWLSYKKKFDNSNSLNANLGFRYNSSNSESDYGLGFNSASDEFVTLGSGESALRVVGGGIGKWNWLNTYLNLNYNHSDKYFATFNLSADGSSRFGSQIDHALTINKNKFAVLPYAGLGWLMSSEQFMANVNFIETLKLRASYGLVGNDDIGNYSTKTLYVSQNFLGRQGLVRSNIGNPSLQWETVRKGNVGLDAALLGERLNISFDWFNNHTKNMLLYEPIASAAGFDYALTNGGELQNAGVELAVSGRVLNNAKVTWDLGFNIATYRNKISSLPSAMFTQYGGARFATIEGKAANLFYGYKTSGVYTSSNEALASNTYHSLSNGSVVRAQAGDVKFVNTYDSPQDIAAGIHVIDENDQQIIGNPNPDFSGGLSNRFSYKRWSLDALLTFSGGNDIYNGLRANLESMSGYQNQTEAVLARWRTNGQVTNIPRAAWGDPSENSRFSDRWIENGSYLRLRTISLSYDVPLKLNFMKSATVYAIANNLATFTRYLGYDPEFSSSGSIYARGVDIGLEPQIRSFLLGVRVGL